MGYLFDNLQSKLTHCFFFFFLWQRVSRECMHWCILLGLFQCIYIYLFVFCVAGIYLCYCSFVYVYSNKLHKAFIILSFMEGFFWFWLGTSYTTSTYPFVAIYNVPDYRPEVTKIGRLPKETIKVIKRIQTKVSKDCFHDWRQIPSHCCESCVI